MVQFNEPSLQHHDQSNLSIFCFVGCETLKFPHKIPKTFGVLSSSRKYWKYLSNLTD